MSKQLFNKKQKLFFLIFLTCGMTVTFLGLPFFNSYLFTDISEKSNPIELDNQFNQPKIAEYQSYSGSGEMLNITLHQSLINTSNIQINYLTGTYSFFEASPPFTGFKSSFTNITVDNINAYNQSITIEDDAIDGGDDVATISVTAFTVPSSCYILNASFYVRVALGSPTATIYLYSSTWDSGNSRSTPTGSGKNIGSFSPPSTNWYNIELTKTFLNNSQTANNTWFIGLYNSVPATTLEWRFVDDISNGDNSDAYRFSAGWNFESKDYECRVFLSPINPTPNPEDIGLKINNTIVNGYPNINGSGYWSSYEAVGSLSGNIQFDINADWYNISCDIPKVQINYTKSDIQAISSFDISSSGLDVNWNVTVPSGLNYFDSRLNNYVINYTIPRIWHEGSIRVFNGSTEKTVFKRLLNNGYREIQVLNAGNGMYWYLNATSSNLFSSIDTYVGGIALSRVNHSDIVRLNTTFIETIYDGILNLSIFTPNQGYLNHTKIIDLTPIGADNEFFVSDWDVSVNVTEYGAFKIQVSWNNDTAAGLLEDYITVIADTSLTLQPYPLKYTFNSSATFNLTVFYQDTGLSAGVEADSIRYQIGSGGQRDASSFYIGGGYYNITIDANDADFNYGSNTIIVSVEKTYYNNQTESEAFTILAETDAYITYPAMNDIFDSGDTIELELYYNDTIKNSGIGGATIEYSLGGSPFRIDAAITDYGTGYYNITISASDGDFGGYGIKDIDVNINMDYHYNQSESVTIKLLGETSPIAPVRVPNKAYYTAAETFNISLYFEDSVKSIGISGATITVDIGGTVYNPTALTDYGDGNYDLIIDCSDVIFSSYGVFPIRINATKTNYYNQTYTLDTLIVGNESLSVQAPNSGAVYTIGQSFDITIEYIDTILSTGIDGATIEYSLNGGSTFNSTGVNSIGPGQYNITIYASDADFVSFGFVDVIIDASKQYYENRSTTYTFHRQITTQIAPQNAVDLGTVIKGLNITYTFNYSDTNLKSIDRVNWTRISAEANFGAWLENLGNGNYTMHLDTTNVLVTGVPYVYEFIVYAVGNETQTLSLTVNVLIIDTDVTVNSYIPLIARNSGLNQTVKFYFNDTTNNLPVLNIATNNIIVKNYATGIAFGAGQFWLYDPYNNGTYILDITMGTRNSGWYTLEVNASKFPNYDYTLFNVSFYYRGNYTDINLISLSDPSGPLVPTGLYNYTIFEGSDLVIEFNITDSEFLDTLIVGDADLYTVRYTNLGTGSNGVLATSLNFITILHRGTIYTSNPALTVGRYLLNLTTSRTNYEDAWFTFNLTITAKYQTNLTIVFAPTQVNAGDELTIILKAEYNNGTMWLPIVNGAIRMTPYFNGLLSTIQNDITNTSGEIKFVIITGSNVRSINITIELIVAYNYQNKLYNIPASQITVIPPTPPLTFDDFLPYIIIIGAALAVVVTAVATYRGVVVPKKKEKQRILTEVKTIFDDAINLEHILVLYKGTGTCIFFKSYGSEQIDPELIGGFLSAVSSFGKEMATQAALNEISYGDKMLLLADGYLIRVALVLGKNASLILRRHLKEFIEMFENNYKDILPNWRGQLNYFKNAGMIVDDILNTSIILPHQISYDFSSVKDLKNPHSRDILKVAQSCCEEAEREFFFIATLLKEASERTSKDTAEIFMGIKELRDKKMLIPIEISAIEAQPISQQELNLINQKVGALTNLTSEEKQKLVQDLAQLGPIEREAYLTSLTKQAEIVTAPIKTSVEGFDVENKKSAKKGIKELLKRGKMAHGKKDYIRAIELYESAAMLASNWELADDYLRIEETIRKTKIEDMMEKKTNLEKEAKEAVKAKNYAEAAAKYKYASRMASEIFKLGDTAMTKEVKRLTNKSNEYEKLK
ncbi:MAG: hypothetical protein EAX91_03620 [Candidatus Lokiarchaeota archaeon]|nr:hypothetical protein [Candidatus Lokiarchaeota archaeon]